jgi:hypothetical protein
MRRLVPTRVRELTRATAATRRPVLPHSFWRRSLMRPGSNRSRTCATTKYEYIRSEVAFQQSWSLVGKNGRVVKTSKPVLDKVHERQIWLSVSDLCRAGLLRENGSYDRLGKNPGERCPDRGSLDYPTYRLLQSLPTPRALLALIYRNGQGYGQTPGQKAFATIGEMLRESIAPPQVSAAPYRAAALIPGVTLVPDAVDAVGRHGVAVAYADTSPGGFRSEWIFDRTTLRMIGEREIDVKTGSLTGTTAILQRAIVDRPGQVPSGQ